LFNEIKSLNEECGVFGAPDASQLTYLGLHNLQHRGQEGAGIVSSDGEHLYQHRDRGLLSDAFADPNDLKNWSATVPLVTFATVQRVVIRFKTYNHFSFIF
jgi:Glutamine phosphoribosylpyrophosphate amidotransferase